MKIKSFIPEFVEYIPSTIEPGILYISMKYSTAVHLCACGCLEKVVTPFSKHYWSLLYNGEAVTLRPSIGNYEYACRSHYFITENRVMWCSSNPVSSDKLQKKTKKKRKLRDWFSHILFIVLSL